MKNIIQENWERILDSLKKEHDVSEVSFKTWLKPLEIYDVEGNLVILLVNEEQQLGIDFIKKKYGAPLKVAIEETINSDIDLELEFISSTQAQKAIEKKSVLPPKKKISNNGLNVKYTFDTFVVGSNNNLAHAASLAVAESPAEVYNPLYIYGGAGLGKTHLMHSIAHFILQRNPSSKVLYVTSEVFTTELIESIRNESLSTKEFREKYRNIDVLLIDDIQFIIGKQGTQEEFFHTFNTLHESKKQIIISSDKPPKDIETLEDRLRSRFEWGLTVDIQSPDYETRMAILKKKEEMDGLNIDNEVLKYIANNIKSNIRELEGALNKVAAFSTLKNRILDVNVAEEALKDMISQDANQEITPILIINTVADHFSITANDIISQNRSKNIVYPRQIAMYLCRKIVNTPLSNIGQLLGKRDHTTILHGIDKIEKQLHNDISLQNTIEIITKKLTPQ